MAIALYYIIIIAAKRYLYNKHIKFIVLAVKLFLFIANSTCSHTYSNTSTTKEQ